MRKGREPRSSRSEAVIEIRIAREGWRRRLRSYSSDVRGGPTVTLELGCGSHREPLCAGDDSLITIYHDPSSLVIIVEGLASGGF